jgi:hypothetical protein
MTEGKKPQRQAIAIALSVARKNGGLQKLAGKKKGDYK